jgi:hypothetical protein
VSSHRQPVPVFVSIVRIPLIGDDDYCWICES